MLKLTKVFEGLSLFLGEKGPDSLSLQLNCKLFGGQMCNHDLGSLLRANVNKMHQVCKCFLSHVVYLLFRLVATQRL